MLLISLIKIGRVRRACCNKMATNSDSNAREVTVSQPSSLSITQSQLASAQSKRRHLKRKRVKRLEKKLELYQRKIKQAMETEVSLEEMNSDTSAYLKEDLLKRKLVKTWYELCEVLRLSPEIQSYTEYNQKYDSTPYAPINRSVERLLKMDTFPDYWDIVHLIEKQNEKHGLGIKDKETQLLARRVFQEVGEIIKANRQKAWSSLFACYLIDNEEDPAVCEPELSKILEESNELGRQRLNEMLDEFAVRQEREGDKTGSSSNGEEEEEDGDKESNESNDGEIASKRLKVDEENEDKINVTLETGKYMNDT